MYTQIKRTPRSAALLRATRDMCRRTLPAGAIKRPARRPPSGVIPNVSRSPGQLTKVGGGMWGHGGVGGGVAGARFGSVSPPRLCAPRVSQLDSVTSVIIAFYTLGVGVTYSRVVSYNDSKPRPRPRPRPDLGPNSHTCTRTLASTYTHTHIHTYTHIRSRRPHAHTHACASNCRSSILPFVQACTSAASLVAYVSVRSSLAASGPLP